MPEETISTFAQVIRRTAASAPGRIAFHIGDSAIDYAALDRVADHVAAALARDGVRAGDCVAAVGQTGMDYLALMAGTSRAGVVLAPLPVSAEPAALAAMVRDCGARCCFADTDVALSADAPPSIRFGAEFARWIRVDAPAMVPAMANVPAREQDPATIIYSSGTTGTPKGIVQPHGYRSRLMSGGAARGYTADSVTLLATPLYSNTTLASLFQTVGAGGTVVLMPKFDAGQWLALAARHRVTHAMLVPVMIDRILAHPDFDRTDLSAFRMKYCTSAPFSAALKRQVLDRWPGGLIELYGMTEGGAAFVLAAHQFPDKLHTVGRPAQGSEVRILDEQDRDVPPGETGEIVGRAPGMMIGYHNRPDATAECRWTAPDGSVWQRTGDIGRIDEDGFLVIVDRKKDMIISGGFNIYPADIEKILSEHPAVRDASVVGVPDARWGETPVAFVVAHADGGDIDCAALREWINARVGKMQRVADVVAIDALPRGPIGKVLKRALRDQYGAANAA